MGFEITATRGTAAAIRASGVGVKTIFKVNEGRPNAIDMLKAASLNLIIYTATSGAHAFSDEKAIRRGAVTYRVPCITTMSGARAAVEAIASQRDPTHSGMEFAGDSCHFNDGANKRLGSNR